MVSVRPLLFLIYISDINKEIADSTVSCFVDDTRILLGIKVEKDTQMLQKCNIVCTNGQIQII